MGRSRGVVLPCVSVLCSLYMSYVLPRLSWVAAQSVMCAIRGCEWGSGYVVIDGRVRDVFFGLGGGAGVVA